MPASTITKRGAASVGLCALVISGCTSVDPGTDFAIAEVTFDQDYFYCHVEPGFIFAQHCGPGDPSQDAPNSCHFTSSAVSGMVLIDHPPVDCGGGDHPLTSTQVGTGSAAEANFESVSLEMNADYTQAPLYVRPSGAGGVLYHPRQVFMPGDPTITALLAAWAAK